MSRYERSGWRWFWLVVVLAIIVFAISPAVRGWTHDSWVSVGAWAASVFAVLGSLLIVGSAAFWVFVALALIATSYFSADDWLEDHEFLPFVMFLLTGGILWLCGNLNIFKLIWNNLGTALVCLVLYLAVGIVYARPKFIKHGERLGHQYEEDFKGEKNAFYRNNRISPDKPIPQHLSADWNALVRGHKADFNKEVSLSQNKGRILTWVYTWPFNLLSELIRNPLRWLTKLVWRAVRDFYAGAEKNLKDKFGNFGADVKVETENPPALWSSAKKNREAEPDDNIPF